MELQEVDLRGNVRFETAPARRIWPSTPVGWFAMAATLLLICIMGRALWNLATFPAAPPKRPEATAPIDQQAQALAEQNAARLREVQEAAERERAAKEDENESAYVYAKASTDAFKASLKDPYSAQFRDVWVMQITVDGNDGGVAVCGLVNARNGFGAYTGEAPFITVGRLSWRPGDANFEEYFRDFCLGGKKLMKLSP